MGTEAGPRTRENLLFDPPRLVLWTQGRGETCFSALSLPFSPGNPTLKYSTFRPDFGSCEFDERSESTLSLLCFAVSLRAQFQHES